MKGKKTCRIKNIFFKRSRFLRNVFKSFWFRITLETTRDSRYMILSLIHLSLIHHYTNITNYKTRECIYVVCACVYILYIYIYIIYIHMHKRHKCIL